MSSRLAPKTGNSQMHQCHDNVSLNLTCERTQYKKGQRGEKKRKVQRGREDKKNEGDGKSRWGNKINPMVERNSSFDASGYHHTIY